jgi:hypothetical protein
MGNRPISRQTASARELLSRRSLLVGALAGSLPLPATVEASAATMIIYVHADDCAPCHIFQAQDWPQFKASPVSRAVHFVRTTAPKTTQAYQVKYWPSEARPFHSAVKVPIVPSFILVRQRQVVLVGNGIVGWRNQVLPQLHQFAASSSEAGHS